MEASYDSAFDAYARGDRAAAIRELNSVAVEQIGDAPALMLRAILNSGQPDLPSYALYRSAVRAAPSNALAWYNLGVCANILSRHSEAIFAYRRSLQLNPLSPDALANAAELLRVNEYFEEALIYALRLQKLCPQSFLGYHNAAICFAHLDRYDEADWHFEQAITLSADPSLIQWEYHHNLLRRKFFAKAWDAFSTRFICGHLTSVYDMAIDLPDWQDEPLTGAHLVVYGEQGLGDQIMYASALKDLIDPSVQISLLVSKPLVPIFAASFPQTTVLSVDDGRDPAQCKAALRAISGKKPATLKIAMGSLLGRFRRNGEDFTGQSYLSPSTAARQYWDDIAADDGAAGAFLAADATARSALKLGLLWQTGTLSQSTFGLRRARSKSMPASIMAALAQVSGVAVCSLSNISLEVLGAADMAQEANILDLSRHFTDLDRTAALIERLDLVITVDTAVAHLAGALGKPVWLLLHHSGDPRWGCRGETDSYWYESMELWWQNSPGDWAELMVRVGAALAKKAGKISG